MTRATSLKLRCRFYREFFNPMFKRISEKQFKELIAPCIGMKVSKVWRGYGSAIFIEAGTLSHRPKHNNPIGEFSFMIEWSWRVEKPRSIWFGSFSSDKIIAARLKQLEGREILDVSVNGRLPELVVQLSGSLWIHSFMTECSQPEWCIFLPVVENSRNEIFCRRGQLTLNLRASTT